MRKFLFILGLWLCLIPTGVILAADENVQVPELNPLCWKAPDCAKLRAEFAGEDWAKLNAQQKKSFEDGWVKGDKPCPGPEWGKCLPAGKTTTMISFGGKSEFANIGEFIIYIYNFAIGIAGIVAVIMIIIAGIQWVTSGGNSEAITSAKKKIGQALIGMFLAYGSFFILNTINPALVNLRLPQVWMVKPTSMVPKFCSALSTGKTFALAAKSDSQDSKVDFTKASPDYKYSYSTSTPDAARMFYCGARFWVKDGGDKTCMGDYCDKGSDGSNAFCMIDLASQAGTKYWCQTGNIMFKVTHSSLRKSIYPDWFTEEWADPVIGNANDTYLMAVCKNEKANDSTTLWDEPSGGVMYRSIRLSLAGDKVAPDQKSEQFLLNIKDVKDVDSRIEKCKDSGGLKGFVFVATFNEANDATDEYHAIGKDGYDLGDISRARNNGFFNVYRDKIPDQYFFTKDEILKPLELNIEGARFVDVDKDEDRGGYFRMYGVVPE